MYTDYILLSIGALGILGSAMSVLALLLSRRRSVLYKKALTSAAETMDVLSELISKSVSKTADRYANAKTEMSYSVSLTTATADSTSGFDKTETQTMNALNAASAFDSALFVPCADFPALSGKYRIIEEIFGGGMSRIFLAQSIKLGNKWIIKYIDSQMSGLSGEENILKLLNHINLPQIIDIFHDETGAYIVETYIEGVSLDKLLRQSQRVPLVTVIEWMEQLTQVLSYLHTREPKPIIHCDLKPSNIMITPDYKPVLIDFGISKTYDGTSAQISGVTYKYAAPEQLKHRVSGRNLDLLGARFGELPTERLSWSIDARTDIYSLGLMFFELIMGDYLRTDNKNAIRDMVPKEIADIILKCVETDPANRYPSCAELLFDINKIKNTRLTMVRSLLMRKVITAIASILFLASAAILTGGVYINGQENAAMLDIRPEAVTISLQQSTELTVGKQMSNGDTIVLDNRQIRWAYSRNDIVRVDGNRISGMNIGESELSGSYRNKTVTLNVRVIEPMDGMIDVSQRYRLGHTVGLYAGGANREHVDGRLADAEFVSPESIAATDDGTIYMADSGRLRKIQNKIVSGINLTQGFLTPRIVRCYKNEAYILTHEWEDTDGGMYYAFIKISGGGAQTIREFEAEFTSVEDFCVSPDGLIYFIERGYAVTGYTQLKTLNPADIDDIKIICELPEGISGITVDDDGNVYLANPETGVVQIWKDETLSYFAGVMGEKAFIDGAAPLFYMPQKIKYAEGALYIWDFNVLRTIDIFNGAAGECITLAGEASPVFDMEISAVVWAAEDVILPNSNLADFAVVNGGVLLLTDPKRGVIWQVE